MGIVLPTQDGGASWQPRSQDHGQSPTLSLGVAGGTCPYSMKLEPTSECGRTLCRDSPVEWRGQGISITVRVEATEEGKCNIKWNQAHSCCLLLLPTAWNGARAGWGPGTSPGGTADHRGQEPVPAGPDKLPGPRTRLSFNRRHERRRLCHWVGGAGCSPAGCQAGENNKLKARGEFLKNGGRRGVL